MYVILILDKLNAPTEIGGIGDYPHFIREKIRELQKQGKKLAVAETIDINAFMARRTSDRT